MDNSVSFKELDWDTEFFGVTCAKAVLHQPLNKSDWNELKLKFNDYEFISIVNENSEPLNAQLIGKETNAFLADVNIQFIKKINDDVKFPQNITMMDMSQEVFQQLTELANFKYSKFLEDPELAKRGGSNVYREWLKNSIKNPEKYFVISKDTNGMIDGFALYSIQNNKSIIELIAVSQANVNDGIGSRLFQAVEYNTLKKGINTIKVGTQSRNLSAINFYHKVGCKQVECHQVYHSWNI